MTEPPSDQAGRHIPLHRRLLRPGELDALHLLLAALALIAMFGLATRSSLGSSPTFDEGFYIARGWAFLKTGHLLPLGHPPFTNVLSGLGVLLEPNLPDPASLRGWTANNADAFSKALLWNSGINMTRVVFLGRFPIILLGVLAASMIYRWGRELYGRWSGWLALLLTAFCPNILAHTGLATTDLGVMAFFILSVYAWSRFLHKQSRLWLILSGIGFGLAQASKFSALVLIPILGLMTLWWVLRKSPIRLPLRGDTHDVVPPIGRGRMRNLISGLAALCIMGLIGLVALWASYLFQIRPYPLAAFVAEFRHFLNLAAEGHRAYLLGHFSDTGWWYYHPFVLAVKLTLPSLVLFAIAITLAFGREIHPPEWEILFPLLAYLGFTMLGSLNVGIRYLLPIIPLIFLFSSRIAYGPVRSGLVRPGVVGILIVAHIVVSIWRFPYYIPFFNLAAGGPDNGANLLADSNLDWGQDLPSLANYLKANNVSTPIYLSYFGQADPDYYGINSITLPGWPPAPTDPARPKFNPLNPSSGMYAISASNLIGVQLPQPDTFGYFRARQPAARIGESIYIYNVSPADVPTNGETSGWFAQCAVPEPSETEPRLSSLTGVESLKHIYFDCTQSLPSPIGPGWILLQSNHDPVVSLGNPDYLARTPSGNPRYNVWIVNGAPPAPTTPVEFPPVQLPIPIAGNIELVGYAVHGDIKLKPGGIVTITEWWRVREPPPPPVSIFAHLIGADETLLVAADGLGVPAEEWQPGMIIIQQHRFTIPSNAPASSYAVAVGLYSLSTGQRFVVSQSGDRVIDRIVLTTIDVEAGN